jgi:hypothetical protein
MKRNARGKSAKQDKSIYFFTRQALLAWLAAVQMPQRLQ